MQVESNLNSGEIIVRAGCAALYSNNERPKFSVSIHHPTSHRSLKALCMSCMFIRMAINAKSLEIHSVFLY